MKFQLSEIGLTRKTYLATIVEPPIWYIRQCDYDELTQWCKEQHIRCEYQISSFFFDNETDRFLFVMRWGQYTSG